MDWFRIPHIWSGQSRALYELPYVWRARLGWGLRGKGAGLISGQWPGMQGWPELANVVS